MRRIVSACVFAALVALMPLGTAGPGAAAAKGHPPDRIVSLSPTATEMLFAIGAGKQVIAVDDQSNFPKRAPKTDLSGFEPNAEAVAGYQPDLVVLPDTKVADTLRALGIKVLVLPAAGTLSDTYSQIRELGDVSGHRANANTVAKRLQSDIARVVAQVPASKKPVSAYYELDDTFFSADSATFIGRLLKAAGFSNIADAAQGDGSGYPQLSSEFVVSSDPAAIFLADTKCCGQTAKTVGARPGFGGLQAVRQHHVIELDDDLASRWGPRVIDLLKTLVKVRKQL